uniref:Putative LOC101237941 [Hydra vulgaris] n=1 Tax=Lepeophtheirus salmonis TaxID=72036 RepID=A0A0K2TTT8_LEPSM
MFKSDPIKRRFGCYRQLSGGISYISVRQILKL